MMLIVGLGNPGKQYEHTRHNVGFQVIDTLATVLNAPAWRRRGEAFITKISRQPMLLLAKPQTYVNRSGHAVADLLKFYRLPTEALLVLTDDLSLSVGQLRLRPSGSSGGHNGLRSIEESLGTNAFARLRIGIGHPGRKTQVKDYVLTIPLVDEAASLKVAKELAVQCILNLSEDTPIQSHTFRISTNDQKWPLNQSLSDKCKKTRDVPKSSATNPKIMADSVVKNTWQTVCF